MMMILKALGALGVLLWVAACGDDGMSSNADKAPDLVLFSPSVSDSVQAPGQSFTLSARVRNSSPVRSAATTLRYYRSTDATISTSDTPVGTDEVGDLPAWGRSEISLISLTAPSPSSTSTYYYGACVESVSGESNTNNNCSTSVRVTVTLDFDLIVEVPSVSDSLLTSGQSFTLSAIVSNSSPTWSAATTLHYYRSTDATISTSDTPVGIGTDEVGDLPAWDTSSKSTLLTAPSNTGTYYYGACVETVSGESNTNNNCSTSVRVTVKLAPRFSALAAASEDRFQELLDCATICRVHLEFPRDTFCVNEAKTLLIAHTADGRGYVQQGNSVFRVTGDINMGWLSFVRRGTIRVITHFNP